METHLARENGQTGSGYAYLPCIGASLLAQAFGHDSHDNFLFYIARLNLAPQTSEGSYS